MGRLKVIDDDFLDSPFFLEYGYFNMYSLYKILKGKLHSNRSLCIIEKRV